MLLIGLFLAVAAGKPPSEDAHDCSSYGPDYTTIGEIGTVKLHVDGKTRCVEKCPPVKQIQNLDATFTPEASTIRTAVCALEGAPSGFAAIFRCTYHDQEGNEIKVAHSFPQFVESAKYNERCLLKGSMITKYSMHSKWRSIITLIISVGIVMCVFVCCVGCICGWFCCS